jgi:SAM-dependent methyltransferase
MVTAKELKSFDRVAGIYDETRSAPPDVASAVTSALLDVLRSVGDAPRLLEVGIGTGRIAVPLAAAGVRVTGIDISPGMLSVLLGKRDDIDVMLAEAAHPPFRDASFDAALFVHILHLVPDADAVIRATLLLLRSGGIVIHGGGDDGVVQNEVDVIITRAKRETAGVDDEARDREANARRDRLMGAIEARGGSVERKRVVSWTQTSTVGHMLERQSERAYSSSWSVPETAHEAFVARLRSELSELPGGLAAEVKHEQTFVLTIGRLP